MNDSTKNHELQKETSFNHMTQKYITHYFFFHIIPQVIGNQASEIKSFVFPYRICLIDPKSH